MRGRDPKRDEKFAELRNELWSARQAVIAMTPPEAQRILSSYLDCKTMQDAYKWQSAMIEEVLKLANPKPAREMGDFGSSSDRAYCPLCGESADNIYDTKGFAFPEGLTRHLEGSYNARRCDVTKAAFALALDHVTDLSDPNAPKLGPIK